jgi:hypothetical protein
LARQLFSPSSWVIPFRDDLRVEFSMALWFLLAAAVTLPEITTPTRVEFPEIGFWFLLFSWQLKSVLGDSPDAIEKIIERRKASLYGMSQFLHTLSIG